MLLYFGVSGGDGGELARAWLGATRLNASRSSSSSFRARSVFFFVCAASSSDGGGGAIPSFANASVSAAHTAPADNVSTLSNDATSKPTPRASA
eukprot:30831-Pelagococcus_subviridis.AAC.16